MGTTTGALISRPRGVVWEWGVGARAQSYATAAALSPVTNLLSDKLTGPVVDGPEAKRNPATGGQWAGFRAVMQLNRAAGVSGGMGAPPSQPVPHLMLLSHERDKLHLGLCGNLKRRTSLGDFAPQHFPIRAALVPNWRGQNSSGEGEVSGRPTETLVVFALQRAPMIASRGSWLAFRSGNCLVFG